MDKYAVIVAGGSGSRMNNTIPKQFLPLKGRPVLYYPIQAFFQAFDDIKIILVLPEQQLATGQEIVDSYFAAKQIKIVAGGETRFHSVQNGLQHVSEDSIVFVHDAVRCLVTKDLIYRCAEAVGEFSSAIPVIDSKDSIRLVTESGHCTIDRETVKLVQTPQAFHSKILLPAFDTGYKDSFTDEASVVEAAGLKVHLIKGDDNNIKITLPIDMIIAEELLAED